METPSGMIPAKTKPGQSSTRMEDIDMTKLNLKDNSKGPPVGTEIKMKGALKNK